MTHTHTADQETQEIFIRLDHYDDIFSDFDLRPYARRSLSVDFLSEMKRATQDKHYDGVDLVLHVPHAHRSEATEATIKERLAAHFHKHHLMLKADKRSIVRRGAVMIGLGVVCMVAATLVVFQNPEHSLFQSFLLVFLEPAAWFLLWEGMDIVLFHSKEITPELNFYRKMASARNHVHFKSHEQA